MYDEPGLLEHDDSLQIELQEIFVHVDQCLGELVAAISCPSSVTDLVYIEQLAMSVDNLAATLDR
jgi:hypothetical protein